jgi:hypothetical protein
MKKHTGTGKTRKILGGVGLAALLTLGLAASGVAQGWGGGPPMGGGGPGGGGPGGGMPHGFEGRGPQGGDMMPMEFQRLHRLLGALDLTDAQMEEIRDIVESVRDEIMELREAHQDQTFSPSSFAEVYARENLTVDDLEDFFEEGRLLREEMFEIVLEGLVDIHDVLTEDQLERIVVLSELAEAGAFGHHM